MSFTIGKRIVLGLGLSFVFTLGLSGFTAYKFAAVDQQLNTLANDCIPGGYLSGQIANGVTRNFSLASSYTIATTDVDRSRLETESAALKNELDDYFQRYEQTITLAEDRAMFEKLQSSRGEWLKVRSEVLSLAKAGKAAEAQALLSNAGNSAFGAFNSVAKDIVTFNQKNGDIQSQLGREHVQSAKTGLIVAVCFYAVFAAVGGYFIVRSIRIVLAKIVATLGEGSSQVACASGQVSQSSQSLAQGASEQAASLEESSSALEEMSSMIKKNADTSAQAATFSNDAKSSADRGTEAMEKMNVAIVDIERSAMETAKIIKTIDEIAFQTNLLALNAAVEAARAGEAGKGFAVVAEEVRNLAMRSADAAKNTSSLIEESVGKAKNGVTIAQAVATNLKQINDATGKVTGLIAEIAAASKEQSTGIDQISQAVGQMDKVTQTNAANAEETAAASEELSAQAEQLRNCVNDLQSLVGIASEASVAPTTPVRRGFEQTSRRTSGSLSPVSQSKVQVKPSAKAVIPLEASATAGMDFSDFTSSKAA